ncbi:MAG TPA: PQQ-binding-like beta-propeller repeat protein [Thermoanaerobaculia bacterium]|jgi:outer membrane protein assembly factor BamB|nr:PQQ-binding-like beta-propeller repeat protein [Thermoanaerobaculia bacterium]
MSTNASNWWMFHGDLAHTGEATGSSINSKTAANLKLTQRIEVPGSILSTPAVVDGFVYVGLANSLEAAAQNGGQFLKIDAATGKTVATYKWDIQRSEGDTHGFCGMGCTPAVTGGNVYFSAFNGKVYCLDANTLAEKWVTDLRYADMAHNQPVTNDFANGPQPKCSGWSSPAVVNGRVYVGVGEGENPYLYGFVYCLEANTGNVIWVFCTCLFDGTTNTTGQIVNNNKPNQIPLECVRQELPPGFTTVTDQPVAKGASVWSGVAVDPDRNEVYAATGNPQPDATLPTPGYTNSVVVLDATTGDFKGFIQIPGGTFIAPPYTIPGPGNVMPVAGSYRPSDIDVDIGGAPTLWEMDGQKCVGIGCKNGIFMVFDPSQINNPSYVPFTRQMLPTMNDGTQIATVDPHFVDAPIDPNPRVTNDVSNVVNAENFHGTYSTAALCPSQGRVFIGVGGNNYHFVSSGIDSPNTPFLRALDWKTLEDAWPLDGGDPQRYKAAKDPNNPLYKNAGESGISVPAVVNDVVFMSTTYVALYAFNAADGTLLWSDTANFGGQTGGFSGGYGYCMGPAIAGNYVVAGALVQGGTGGVLNIYTLGS